MRSPRTALLAILLGGAPSAFAQPGATPASPATGGVPVTNLAGANATNLHVDLKCADYWATPARGMVISVDGAPTAAVGIEGQNVLVEGRHGPYTTWVPTDVMYGAPTGVHRVQVEAPGCAPFAQDLTFGMMPTELDGRLAITDDALRGTAAAPNGIGLLLGAAMRPVAARSGTAGLGEEQSAFTSQGATEYGLVLSTTLDRRHLAMGLDTSATWGSTTGELHETSASPITGVTPGAMPYSESIVDWRTAYRIGVRAPLHDFALAAGAGLGFDLRVDHLTATGASDPFAYFPTESEGSLFVPVWAAVTYKPSCNAGVQVMASYDLGLVGKVDDAPTITAGLLWQPNAACSEAPGVTIR